MFVFGQINAEIKYFLGENCWGVEWTKIRRFKSQIFKFLLSLGHWANGYKMSDQYGNRSSLTFQQKKKQMVEFPAASYDGNLRLHVCLPNMIPTQTWFERIMAYKWPILQLTAKNVNQRRKQRLATSQFYVFFCVWMDLRSELDGFSVLALHPQAAGPVRRKTKCQDTWHEIISSIDLSNKKKMFWKSFPNPIILGAPYSVVWGAFCKM